MFTRIRADVAPTWLILLSVGFLMTGCGGGEESPTERGDRGESEVLHISQGSDVLTMDPYFRFESPTMGVLINIFNPLTDISPDMRVVPALAVSWRNLEPLLWEFKLREGVKFHQGQDFDAEDVKFSLARARNWEQSKLRSEIPTVKEVHIVDPYLIRIETTIPDAILPKRLASILILDSESAEKGIAEEGQAWLSAHANGTGPYRLKKWLKDQYCRLTANEDYWGGAPTLKEMQFFATSNDSTRIANFLDGGLDILSHVPVRDVARVDSTPGFDVVSRPSLRVIYLGFDVTRDKSPGLRDSPPNPFKKLKVRQAVYAAINEELIIEKIMNGQAAPAAQLFPDTVVGHDPTIEREPFDLEKAKRLMAEAGYADGFRVRLDTPNDRYVNDAQIASAVAGQLAKINIRLDVNAIPKARFFDMERAGECSFYLLGWANTNGDGIGTFDHLLHTPDLEKNLGGSNTSTLYSNLKVDRISESASAEFDPEAREKILQAASRAVMRDLPHIPLHYQMDIYAVSDRIEWSPRADTQIRGTEVRWK